MTNRRQLVDAVEVTDTGIHIVRLKKIFDATSVSEFEKVLAYLFQRQHYKIVVDLTHVEFVASAGWGAFTAEFRNVRTAGGDIRLAGMNPDVQDVFFLLELDSFINAYNHVDEAIASFEAEISKAGNNKAGLAAEAAPDAKGMRAYGPEAAEPDLHEGEPEAHEQAEGEPVAFEVAEIYDPAYRNPWALGPGAPAAHTPEDEAHDLPPASEEDGWVISEEIQAEAEELAAFEADENFFRPALLPGKTPARQLAGEEPETDERSGEFARFAEEFSRHSNTDSRSQEDKPAPAAAPSPAHVAEEPRAPRTPEPRPPARAKESTRLEDFELQDIHDPWILEEIDTLPEEDDFEAGEWNSTELSLEEPEAAPDREDYKQGVEPAAARALAAPKPPTGNEQQQFDRGAKPPARRALAEKAKAAPSQQTIRSTPPVAQGRLEEDHIETVKRIVSDHPHYGPAMIQKFFETRLEPPMAVSRSTIYRWLKLAGLNTREQRLEFAGKAGSPN